MMDWREKLAEAKKLQEQAKAILENPESTAEEKGTVEELMEGAKALKKEGVQLKEIEMDAVELEEKVEEKRSGMSLATDREVKGEEFKSVTDVINGIRAWARLGVKDPRLVWYNDKDGTVVPFSKETKDLVESVGASGGFLVPTEFIARLYAALAERNFVRQRATIIPMRRRQVAIPVLDQTGTTANVPHWFGGMTFYWAEEATEKTEADPSFRKIDLVAHKLIGYTRASDELVEDTAISLEAFLMGELGFVGGANWHEEYCFIQGTGVGQPLGVIPAGATITVARAADGAIGYADLCNMVENFLPTGNGVWVITQSALSDLLQLNGPTGNPSYIWGNAVSGQPPTLLGYPVIWTEKCPRIGTAGDVILADWRYYLIGDRKAATVESTQFDRWRYDETSWRMVHRVDGQPWLSAPLTLQDGTSQISPFVILGNKST